MSPNPTEAKIKVFTSPQELSEYLNQQRRFNRSIGFVPTMGALHQGHVSLVQKAESECELVVMSIFVNPAQFNQSSDYTNYPKTLEADLLLLEKTKCEAVFCPSIEVIYPQTSKTQFSFGEIETVFEGQFRPGHFAGVGLIVSKLFNIIGPCKAYFGEKDLQQLAVIKQMVYDLNFPVEVIPCPTIREISGLAQSSRNQRLNPKELEIATTIYKVLASAKTEILGFSNVELVIDKGIQVLSEAGFKVEYLSLVDALTFSPLNSIEGKSSDSRLIVAAWLGEVRLIDNIRVL